MAGELLMGLGAFKTMFDLAKGLKDLNDAAARNSVAIDLQEKILAAQAQQAACIERVGDLEKEVARLKTWEREKQRYRLTAVIPGVFAYVLKRSEANGETPHALCANCYERGEKSFLQESREIPIQNHALECPLCKTVLKLGGRRLGELLVD